VRYEANAVKHISYLLAATLAVAFLTSRQGCAQDATKLVPTEPAPATGAAPVKTHPAHGEANVQRYACGAVRDSEGCDISSGVSGADAKRHFGVGAAGAAEIDSKVSFADATTGHTCEPCWQLDFFGGKSEDTVKGYARQVVTRRS